MKAQTESVAEWHRAVNGHRNKKRAGVSRYPGGRIVHADRKPVESEESILAVAMAHPHRKGARNPRSALLGHALGRLLASETITGKQFAAGEHFTRVTVAHMRHITGTVPRFPSIMASQQASSGSGAEPDEDRISDIRRAYADMMGWVADAGELHDATRILTSVCIMDRNPRGPLEIGTMRCALNMISRNIG